MNIEDKKNFDFIRNPADLKISDLLPDRPTVGNDIPVILWRLIRLVGLYNILGEEAQEVSYFTGKNIGQMLEIKNIDEIYKLLTDLKIGKIDFFSAPNLVHVSIQECFTCSGITPPLGRPICHLESGIIAGALENIYKEKKIFSEETKCIGGLGDKVCLIECKII